MATRTVRPSGGDYTTLAAWEAGRQGNLTGLGPEIAECSGNLSDTAVIFIGGWTTTAADYIQIVTPQADRHLGVWDTSKYRLEPDVDGFAFTTEENYVRLEGLQLRQTRAGGRGAITTSFLGASSDFRIEACLLRTASTDGTAGRGDVMNLTTGVVAVRNCIIFGGNALNGVYVSGATATVDNCTIVSNGTYGVSRATGTATVRNTYCGGQGTNAFNGTMTRTTCAHSSATVFADSTASVAHSTANFLNVTGGSEDYHLQPTASATLLTGGTDLSGTFTTDIDGETRSDWGIGADEVVSGGPPAVTVHTMDFSGVGLFLMGW